MCTSVHVPPLVLEAGHLNGSVCCIGLPEQAMGWFLLGLGLIIKAEYVIALI